MGERGPEPDQRELMGYRDPDTDRLVVREIPNNVEQALEVPLTLPKVEQRHKDPELDHHIDPDGRINLFEPKPEDTEGS